MKEQTAARAARLAQRGAEPRARPCDAGLTQVVAVVAGEGNKALFRNLGVDLIVDGGQSMNPSTEDLMRAVEKAAAPSVIILPNNGNVIMTAEQTVGLTDREVLVVPSRSIQAGLSAAVAYEQAPVRATRTPRMMRAAVDRRGHGEITRAVRDSLVDGVQVKAGDFIGLIDDKVVVAAPDLEPVVDDVVARLLDGGREMLTALIGERRTRAGPWRRSSALRAAVSRRWRSTSTRAGSRSIPCCCRRSRPAAPSSARERGARDDRRSDRPPPSSSIPPPTCPTIWRTTPTSPWCR